MKLLDILTSPWAIQPEKLVEIQAIYATHLRGEKIDIAGIEARIGKPLVNEPKAYQVQDGVAVLQLDGVLAKRANMFMQVSGGTSMQLAERDLKAALADPSVHSIILAIDSPGGTVDGTQTLADAVLAARAQKPVVALASGTMASAAYWVGSAAQKVYINDSTTQVGSIGVVMKHVDVSKAEAAAGQQTTEIYSGKYKRIASNFAPLSEEGRAHMQAQADYVYGLFVDAVAKNRGVSPETVLQDMADGQIFIGQQAVDAGLVDGVSTLSDLIGQLNAARSGTAAQAAPASAGAAHKPATQTLQGVHMDRATLAAQHPELLAALVAEGASAERTRILGVQAHAIPGHEALIASLVADGTTQPDAAAAAVLSAHRKVLAADAPQPLRQVPTPSVAAPAPAADAEDSTLPIEDRAKKAWDASADTRAEFAGSFDTYLAYAKAEDAGQVKVLSKK